MGRKEKPTTPTTVTTDANSMTAGVGLRAASESASTEWWETPATAPVATTAAFAVTTVAAQAVATPTAAGASLPEVQRPDAEVGKSQPVPAAPAVLPTPVLSNSYSGMSLQEALQLSAQQSHV